MNFTSAFFILAAGALWGLISLFVNALKSLGLNSIQCVALRVLLSAVIMIIYILLKDKSQLKIKLKDIGYFIGTGILSIVFFNFCYFEAIEQLGGAAVPALLLYMAPVFVMLISLFVFKEKITANKLAALIMTVVGLCFVTGVFTGGERISLYALMLGLGSGLGYALYSIFGKLLADKYGSITITAYTFIVASIGVVPFSGLIPKMNLLLNPTGIFAALGLAVISTVAPYLLYTNGLRRIEAGKAAILATVEPVVAAIVGVVVFHEEITLSKLLGMLFIILAIVALNVKITRNQHS
ncbi:MULTISPECIES: DMT family transporter [unclassified Ruminococcus]|uniref:DMT family transporter n=1 Tax=unclassified Ruminococcus TaxID=2608920 RepID=UPI00210EE700|nr:EamA family transporter [Ruminococcus sp. zg-924]MCQ4114331.1 EamA family transporter [Ruminococcus sp. zg-921]